MIQQTKCDKQLDALQGTTRPDVLATREASRRLVRELEVVKAKVGLLGKTYTQGHILLYVEAGGLLTVAELAAMIDLDKSTTSRAVTSMVESGHLVMRESKSDKRLKPVALTQKGRKLVERIHKVANAEVESALALLTSEEREIVVKGITLYARSLRRSRAQREYEIRDIRKGDNAYMSRVIHEVMSEFQLNVPGSSLGDAEVSTMYEAYDDDRATYFVVTHEGRVVGGAGIARLEGGDESVCELKKMYLLTETRGVGLGERLLERCIAAAREAGYQQCYLETIREMKAAQRLYEKHGFRRVSEPMGSTGHFRTDSWYVRDL